MKSRIGIVAGKILAFLERQKDPVSILEIKFTLDEPNEFVNMGIGWLVRERHIGIVTKGNENYLSLSPSEVLS